MEARTIGEVVKGRPVYVVQESDSVLDAARYMTEYGVEAVPVLDDGRLVGMFAGRDLMARVVALGLDPAKTRVGQVMTSKVAVVDAESDCQEAVAVMDRLQVRHLPVLTGRRLVGCVSLRDLQEVGAEGAQVQARFVEETDTTIERQKMSESREALVDRLRAIPGGEHVYMCYSCGTCVGSCMMQKVEPSYNARRLIQKVVRGMPEEAFEDRTAWLCSACDLCYPACPQQIHISDVLNAVRELAVDAGYHTVVETAQVDQSTCVACGLCAEICPYEAIELQETRIMGQARTVAHVDANRCMACGLCAASCRSSSIELTDGFSNEALMADLWQWVGETQAVVPVEVEVAVPVRATQSARAEAWE
ncbi:MAG: CBS domain-containing protein [Anaerolineae bacterium]|jgi:heterodisulfide reductase subunit C/CBS domain-containing protein